jgi:WD40 repeat protein
MSLLLLFIGCTNMGKPERMSDLEIQFVTFNSDGTLLITQVENQKMPRYWSTSTGLQIEKPDTFVGKYEWIQNNLGTYLIIRVNDQKQQIIDVLSDKSIGSYLPAGDLNHPIMISPQKRFLLEWVEREEQEDFVPRDNRGYTIRMHSLESGELLRSFLVSQRTNFSADGLCEAPVTFSDDEKWLVIARNRGPGTGGEHALSDIFDAQGGYPIQETPNYTGANNIKLSYDKRYLAEYNDEAGWFAIRDLLGDKKETIRVPIFTEKLYFINDHNALCVTNNMLKGRSAGLSRSTAKLAQRRPSYHAGPSIPGRIVLLNIVSGEMDTIADSILTHESALSGNKFVYFDLDFTMKLMDVSTFKVVWKVKPRSHNECYQFDYCAFSPDSKYLAAWNAFYVALWDVEKRKLIRYLSKKSDQP